MEQNRKNNSTVFFKRLIMKELQDANQKTYDVALQIIAEQESQISLLETISNIKGDMINMLKKHEEENIKMLSKYQAREKSLQNTILHLSKTKL